jgi:hypothetical protein
LLVYLSPAARAEIALQVRGAPRREIVGCRRERSSERPIPERRNREVESDRYRNFVKKGKSGRN